MKDRDVSSIEFHKVLRETEEYRRIKAGIRNQTKTNLRLNTKNSTKNCLKKEKRGRQKGFFTRNHKYSRNPGSQYHLNHKSSPVLYPIIISPSTAILFQVSFLTAFSKSFFLYTISYLTSCLQNSFRHFVKNRRTCTKNDPFILDYGVFYGFLK